MGDLNTIRGIGKATRELLEAAGYSDVKMLAAAGVDELVAELKRANGILQLAKRTPSSKDVEKWIGEARRSVGVPAEPVAAAPPPAVPVNYETTPQVMALLAVAPLAIPLPARQLVASHLAVSDIPPAILLNRYSGDLEIRVTARETVPRAAARAAPRAQPRVTARPQSSSSYVTFAEPAQQRLEIDTSRVRSTADLEQTALKVPVSLGSRKSDASTHADRVALIRAPLEQTNRGRDPRSRFYVRGVLHTHPVGMTVGAIVTLLLAVLLPVAIIASVLLLLSSEYPDRFPWVSPWLLVLPCALPVLGLFYLIFGVGGKCRICTQGVFLPRGCRKNAKAHHVPGLGHIIPLCFHLLVFRWFRCTYCGTPVRLKK